MNVNRGYAVISREITGETYARASEHPHCSSTACTASCLCHRHMLHMLVTMSNTHIEGGEGAEKRRKRKRGRGLRQWQRAPRAPREKQVGAVNDERDGDGDRAMKGMSWGGLRQWLMISR